MPVSIDREAEPPPMQADYSTRREDDVSTSRRATPLARRLARERGIDIWPSKAQAPRAAFRAPMSSARASRTKARRRSPVARRARRLRARRSIANGCDRVRAAPLVLLHGFGADLNAWRFFLADRAARLPGARHRSAGPWRIGREARRRASTRWSAEVAETLHAEGPGAIHLAGHSLGGAVAAALAGTSASRRALSSSLHPPGSARTSTAASSRAFSARAERCRTRALRRRARESILPCSALPSSRRRCGSDEHLDGALEELAAVLFPDATQAFSVRSVFDGLVDSVENRPRREGIASFRRGTRRASRRVAIHQFSGARPYAAFRGARRRRARSCASSCDRLVEQAIAIASRRPRVRAALPSRPDRDREAEVVAIGRIGKGPGLASRECVARSASGGERVEEIVGRGATRRHAFEHVPRAGRPQGGCGCRSCKPCGFGRPFDLLRMRERTLSVEPPEGELGMSLEDALRPGRIETGAVRAQQRSISLIFGEDHEGLLRHLARRLGGRGRAGAARCVIATPRPRRATEWRRRRSVARREAAGSAAPARVLAAPMRAGRPIGMSTATIEGGSAAIEDGVEARHGS